MDEASEIEIDLNGLSAEQLAARLRDLAAGQAVRLKADDARQLDGVGAGMSNSTSIHVDGSLGHFAFLLAQQASVEVSGNVGDGCGHSLVSGAISVHGSAAGCVGAFATGGFIAILGNAGSRCGLGLSGGDVFVRSTVGDEAGHSLRGGTLVLGNGAGRELGRGMTDGIIYVRGEVKSLSANTRAVRMKDPDYMRLGLLLARAGIKSDGKEFKAYRARTGVAS